MKEIKSVRIRRNNIDIGTLDIKVTIFKNDTSDERVLIGTNNGNLIWKSTIYKKSGIYKDFSDNQFIDDFINLNKKISGSKIDYSIIQDPWEDIVPKWRKYGFDPYYLNNGTTILISWINNDGTLDGGTKYSDNNGNEINSTSNYSKSVTILSNELPMHFTDANTLELKSKGNAKQWNGMIKDKSIISEVIDKWKNKVANYDLQLCDPDNERITSIDYKSPLEIVVEKDKISVANNEIPKEKMTIVLPTDQIKAKNDITSFMVYIGNVNEIINGIDNEDDYEFSDSGINEYTESEFIGNDEAKWEPLNDVDDDTFDPDEKGGDEIFEPISNVPTTQIQRDFIKRAIKATLSKGQTHGKCARYTFNHVNNYVRLMQGKEVELGAVHNAGGNANGSMYHRNLQNMGYDITTSETLNKQSLIDRINNGLWSVGDVIVYWCTDGPSGASHVKYGHTQIFTNGFHNDSNYRWSTDNENNYRSSFVYRNKPGDTYKFIHFQAPRTKKLEESV